MRQLIAALAVAVPLAGCGVGLSLGWSDDDWYRSDRPSVSIASPQASAPAGGSVRVIAAASDDDGIDSVAFYRLDGTAWLRLGADTSSPYEWDVAVPADGRTTLDVFARARDRFGHERDSDVLRFTVTP